jgi:iron complex transport system substrate-binding protein
MVTAAGAEPILGVAGERSRRVEWSDVSAAQPDLVVVAPCGYRLDGAAALAEQVIAADVVPPHVPVWAVDADAAFVRPGPRVVDGVEALAHIAHPESVNPPPGLSVQLRGASATTRH